MFVGFALIAVLCSGQTCHAEQAVSDSLYPSEAACINASHQSDYPLIEGEFLQCASVVRKDF